jgi:aminomethyltransferase
MGLRTPLYDWHVAHAARMVDFGGWDMPVQYTTIIDEHTAVRTGAGLFDVSHMGRLSFAGPDSLALIQHVFTNDAATMKDGQVRYGLICNERGGVRDDVLVYRWLNGYEMVVNAGNREKIVSWLGEHKGRHNVKVSDRTMATCMAAVQGPKAVEMCRDLTAFDPCQLAYYHAAPSMYQGKPCVVSRTGYTGEDGVEIVVSAAQGAALFDELAARGAKPCGLGARDTLRLEAAMPLYGHELTEDIDPLQAGLGWAVKLNKGDFIGREALLHLQQNKTQPVRIGLVLEGKRIAREATTVLSDSRPIGRVTSGTFAPTLQKALAMAYVEPALSAVGTALSVDVRGKIEAARVVALPFYRRPQLEKRI